MIEDFAHVIKTERERRGKTQSWLANEVGITVGHVSRIESGDRVPSIDLLEKILKVLDLQIVLRKEEVVG